MSIQNQTAAFDVKEEDTDVINDSAENNTYHIPKLQRMTSADGSCAIQDCDLEFIGEHSKLCNDAVKRHFTGLLQDGRVDKDAFRKIVEMCYPGLDIGRLEKHIFKLVDRNSDEEITVEEFRAVVHDIFVLANERKISVQVENQLVEKAFSEMDTNADGKVVLDEFIKACKTHNYIVITYIKNFAEKYNQKQIS